MNTAILTQTKIDIFSGDYLNGEFDGAIGETPNVLLWSSSSNYRAGFFKGIEKYYDQKYGVVKIKKH